MIYPLRLAVAALASLLAAMPAQAATIKHISMAYSAGQPVPHFSYTGPVEAGDLDTLAEYYFDIISCRPELLPADGGNCTVVTFDSPGGDYLEGLEIAHWLRANAIAAVVESGDGCYSACAFAFMGGSGHSGDRSIGAYVDRTIEPGGVVGFHAPYLENEAVEALIAARGVTAVLGTTRIGIASMVEQLVHWNVDPQVLASMVSMGPEDMFNIAVPLDMYLARVDLPDGAIGAWNADAENALYNACLNLLAHYENSDPMLAASRVNYALEHNVGNNAFGETISGYRVASNGPSPRAFAASRPRRWTFPVMPISRSIAGRE